MKRKRRAVFSSLLNGAGSVLILAALVLTAYNLWDMRRAADDANQVLEDLSAKIPDAVPAQPQSSGVYPTHYAQNEEIPDYILWPEMDMPEEIVDGDAYIGTLEIPELGICLPVASEWSYRLLRKAPCRYSGSAYMNDLVIAAHNYSGHFGRLSGLSVDSKILFTDVDGNVFSYAVTEFETLEPVAVETMVDGNPGLTLFTCTVGGQSRIALRARSVPAV